MKQDTKLIHLARPEPAIQGTINLPVYRASTIVSPDAESYLARHEGARRFDNVTYGATGTHNARALAEMVAELEGGYRSVVTASGLSAVTLGISAYVSAGDHLLVTDTVYGPTRRFCDVVLARYGVETSYFPPDIDASELKALMRPSTRMVYLEAPGSLTFEMHDVPALAAAAREHGALSAIDNTWATPIGFKPFEHGLDVSIQAGTKYLAGHSDLVIGMITTARQELYEQMADHVMAFGDIAGADDCFATLRGVRTLSVRLARQQASAMRITEWLAAQPKVARVLYPPLAGDPGHALYARDFRAGASLFGLLLANTDFEGAKRFVDALELFHIGSSWGGFESLVAINRTPLARSRVTWADTSHLLRLHIGLEDAEDLIADLQQALARV